MCVRVSINVNDTIFTWSEIFDSKTLPLMAQGMRKTSRVLCTSCNLWLGMIWFWCYCDSEETPETETTDERVTKEIPKQEDRRRRTQKQQNRFQETNNTFSPATLFHFSKEIQKENARCEKQ